MKDALIFFLSSALYRGQVGRGRNKIKFPNYNNCLQINILKSPDDFLAEKELLFKLNPIICNIIFIILERLTVNSHIALC